MWTWNSDPFGTDAGNPNPFGAGGFTYNLRFPGQLFDGQAGLNQNYFRDYDPATGRYVESDPIGLAGGNSSTYAYVDNATLGFVDPVGLAPSCGADDRCAQLRKNILTNWLKLISELRKYSPIEDAKGGFPMQWGSGFTKPGGHYTEITNLQRGLKHDIAEYKRLCSNDNDRWPPIPRAYDEAASRDVPAPIITPQPGISVPSNNGQNLVAPTGGLLGILALIGALAL
jgi:RHS repeat-associated protein